MHTLTETPAVSASSIHASFLWERREHVRLIRQITRHARRSLLARLSMAWIALVAVFALVVPALSGDWVGVGSVVPWVTILVLWLLIFRYGLPWVAARSYPKQHPCVTAPFRVTLTDEGVRTTCNHSDILVRWGGIQRAIETREFILLYTNARCAHYLPKRALAAPGELDRARDLILRHAALQDATAKG